MPFDTHSAEPEAVRRTLMDAIGACDAAKGRLMAALAMRTTPALAIPAIGCALVDVVAMTRSVNRAVDLLRGQR